MSMKKWLIPAMILLVIISCKNNSAEPQVNVIMPLGASRLQGSPPAYLSYRYDLWKQLRLNDYHVDFIGGEVDGEIYPLVEGHAQHLLIKIERRCRIFNAHHGLVEHEASGGGGLIRHDSLPMEGVQAKVSVRDLHDKGAFC